MANPYLNYFLSQSTNVSVNNIKANAFGNIILNIDSFPDLESLLNNAGTSNVSNMDDLTDGVVLNPINNQTLICTNGTFSNSQMDHVNLLNVGNNSHSQSDTFVSEFAITTPLNNQGLIYNSTDSKFEN